MNAEPKEKCLCPVCDWQHSFLQESYPGDKKMENLMSLNEARRFYAEEKTSDCWEDKLANKRISCPVCGKTDFTIWDEYCTNCFWCHDYLQEKYPERKNISNKMSLNEAKMAYLSGTKIH